MLYLPLRAPLTGTTGHPAVTVVRNHASWYREADDANGERWAAGAVDVSRVHSWDGKAAHIGTLLEPARTNRVQQSQALATAPWASFNSPTFAADARVAPDGTTTADDIGDDIGSTREGKLQSALGLTAGAATASVFCKRISTNGSGNPVLVPYDGSAFQTAMEVTSETWVRVASTWTASGGASERIDLLGSTTAALDGAGIGVGAFWQAQAENGLYPTSPIPTTTAVAARAADSFSLNVASLHGLLGASFGRVKFVWIPAFANTEETGAVWLFGIDATCGVRYQGSDDTLELFAGGARVASIGPVTFARNASAIIVEAVWNADFCALSVIQDGTSLGTVNGTWTQPTLGDGVFLGSNVSAAAHATGTYTDLHLGHG